MKLKNRLYFLIILFGSVLLYRCDSPNSEVDFSSQVKPLLNAKCISCHGGVKKNAGFSVLFEEEAMASLATGHPAIVPGQAEKSRMIQVLTENDIEHLPSLFEFSQLEQVHLYPIDQNENIRALIPDSLRSLFTLGTYEIALKERDTLVY